MSAFEGLLPAGTIIVEAEPSFWEGGLLPEEQACVAHAVPARVREFCAGRNCARRALAQLEAHVLPIRVGPGREPLFPAGIAGSITHTRDYCAAAVVRTGHARSLGLDAEPDEPLPPEILQYVAAGDECALLAALADSRPEVHWDKVLFCAKEAFFKAWFPLTRRYIAFQDARVRFDPAAGTFAVGLRQPGPDDFWSRTFGGRFAIRRGLVLAALALPPAP